MAEFDNEVEVKMDVEDVLPEEVIVAPAVPTKGIVMPTVNTFGQTMINTATTMVCGAIIGAGMNALAAGISKGLRSGAAWGKEKLAERKERKALKAQEKKALEEIKAEEK